MFWMLMMLLSCDSKSTEKIILNDEEKQLIEIMTDLYIAEAALKNVEAEFQDSLKTLYRSQIEKIHKIDLIKVEETIKQIQEDPYRYDVIHRAVEDTLAFRSKRFN